jgi:DmsE family decaheme c-type cytochrome
MRIRSVVLGFIALLTWFSTAGRASPMEQGEAPSRPILTSFLLAAAPGAGIATLQEQGAETEDCRFCHEAEIALFNRTFHASQEESCYACHKGAPAEEHMRGQLEGEDIPGPNLTTLPIDEANAVCVSCHESSHHSSWEGSPHQRRGVKCMDCHSVHTFESDRKQLKTAVASETCFECHQNIRAMSLRTSHHPVREGLLGCESCHNPHDGNRPKMIKADWANDLCYQCHTEKRGPFLWEHAPVRENCLNCHNPHGSNHDKMLVAKPPFLCQRCHLNTRHPSTFFDGSIAGASAAAASNRAVEHACKNCHQNIHGSNSPSAPYLGR